MDILSSSYYIRINQYLSFYGHWPEQSLGIKIRNQVLIMTAVLSIYVPYFVNVYEVRNDFQELLLAIPPVLYYTQSIAKNLFAFIKRKEIKKVLDAIRRDFQIYKDNDMDVLHEYSKKANTFNNFYTAYMFMVVSAYSALPLTLYVIDIFMASNETLLEKPRPISYHIETIEKNFLLMTVHGLTVDLITIIFVIGLDTLYLIIAYHASALFVIIHKNIRRTVNSTELQCKKEDVSYRNFVKIISMHADVLEFAQTIESAFASLNLITIGCSMIPLVITGYEVLENRGNPTEMMRYSLFAFAEIIHLFYYNWPGQKITDHSLIVHKACYDCEWYEKEFSIKSKRVMNLMLLRSQKPCYMTAGKIYILGLENFAAAIKVSMSYFTVLLSIT